MLHQDDMPVGPNISNDNEHFFQSDADLIAAKNRALKKAAFGTAGAPITMASKVLSLTLLPGQSEATAFVGESGFSLAQLNLESRSRERDLKGHAGPVTCVLYLNSPKGATLLTASWDKTIRHWDASTGKTLQVLKGHLDFVKSLAVRVGSGDKVTLFSGSTDATIREWDLETGRSVATLKGHRRGVESILLDPSGTILFSASSDTTIRKWNAQTRQCLEVWEGHLTSIYSLSMNESYLFSGMFLCCVLLPYLTTLSKKNK
jgi:WD40 repeat protein